MGPKRTATKRNGKSNGETNVAKETERQLQKSLKDKVATEINDADVAENSDEEFQLKETATDLDEIPDKKVKRGKAIIVAQELKYSDPDEDEETKDMQPKNKVPLKRGKRNKAIEVESSSDQVDNDGETVSSVMNVNEKSKRAKKAKNTEMEDKFESVEDKVASVIPNVNEGRPKRGKGIVNYYESKEDAEGENVKRMQTKRQKRKKVADELNEEDAGPGDLGYFEEKANKEALVPEEKAGKKKKANQKVSNKSTVNKIIAEPLGQEKQNEEDQDDLGESSGDEVKPKKAKSGKAKTQPPKKKLAKGKKSLTDEEEPDTGIKLKKIAESLAQEKQNEEYQEDLRESSGDEVKPKAGKAKTLPQKNKLAKGKKSFTDYEEEPDTESIAQEKQSGNEEEENIKEDSEDEVKLKKGAKPGKAKSVPKKKTGKGKITEEGELEDSDSEDKSKKAKGSKSANAKVPQQIEKVIDVEHLDFSNHSTSSEGEKWNLKITSWNVNGIRSWLQKDGLKYLHRENPDVMCVQETKCADDKLPTEIINLDGYHCYWLSGDKEGYSGVGLLSKEKPIDIKYGIGIEKLDIEGRVITAEYEKFILVGTYIPNAGRGLVRLGYRQEFDIDFRNYLKKLDEKKPIVLCGDLNVAHQEIDLTNPKTNKKTAGFTVEERNGFTTLLEEGFVDSFRHLYPEEKNAYTFWSYMAAARAKNVGWRMDYFVLSQRLIKHLCDNVIRKDVLGSDHCPVTLFLAV